jgi:protein-tyrosine phosphatase
MNNIPGNNYIPISRINKYIYLGTVDHYLDNSEEFNKMNIDIVIICAKEAKLSEKTKCNTIKLPIIENDAISFLENIDRAAEIIKNNLYDNKKIYICSTRCSSRAPAILIYYLMIHQNLTYDKAYELLKNIRPSVDIEPEIEDSLRIMEN